MGSGAVDIVINRRLKCRRAMRWRRANADRVVALRTLMLNNDWNKLWTCNLFDASANGPNELYNLANDPFETRNLVDSPDRQILVAKLRTELETWYDR